MKQGRAGTGGGKKKVAPAERARGKREGDRGRQRSSPGPREGTAGEDCDASQEGEGGKAEGTDMGGTRMQEGTKDRTYRRPKRSGGRAKGGGT